MESDSEIWKGRSEGKEARLSKIEDQLLIFSMNLFLKIAAIIYHSYDDRGVDIPYFRTIATIVLILVFHLFHIGIIFDIPSNYFFPWNSHASKANKYLSASIYIGVFIVIFVLLFKKSRLQKVNVSQKQIYIARKVLPIYLVGCVIFLGILLLRAGIEKGTIDL